MVTRFLAVVLVTSGVLAGLNALPAALGGESRGVIRYASLEALESRYDVRLWAPSRPVAGPVRLAPGDPGWLAFAVNASGPPSPEPIVVCQTLGPSVGEAAVPAALLAPGEILQATDVASGARHAQMRRVMLADGSLVYELWWRDAGRRVMLRMHADANRLLRFFDDAMRQSR